MAPKSFNSRFPLHKLNRKDALRWQADARREQAQRHDRMERRNKPPKHGGR